MSKKAKDSSDTSKLLSLAQSIALIERNMHEYYTTKNGKRQHIDNAPSFSKVIC